MKVIVPVIPIIKVSSMMIKHIIKYASLFVIIHISNIIHVFTVRLILDNCFSNDYFKINYYSLCELRVKIRVTLALLQPV